MYERQIQQQTEKISSLKSQIEELIIERINDRDHASIYNSMIAKREEEIIQCQKKITELQEYDKVCKEKRKELKNTTNVLDSVIAQGTISDINLRMLVKRILIHQNKDKSIDITFEMNGDFDSDSIILSDP